MSLEVVIDSLAYEGYGLARHEGKVLFVEYAVPGDRLQVAIYDDRENYAFCRIEQILEPSPIRIEPVCPSFGRCGGCQWLNIDYQALSTLKGELFADVVKRLSGLSISPLPIIPANNPYHYRMRIEVKVRRRGGENIFGFFRRSSYKIVPIEHCYIASEKANEILKEAQSSFRTATDIPFEYVEINTSPQAGEGIIIFHIKRRGRDRSLPILQECASGLSSVKGWSIAGKMANALKLGFEYAGLNWQVSGSTFYQVNFEQNINLINKVLEFAELTGAETVLDLFCGMGNLSLPLARRAKFLYGIDNCRPAIEDAKHNAEQNDIGNVDFKAMDAERFLEDPPAKFDLVVLDPPRVGCGKLCSKIASLNPKKIIYVSCNPATLARDIKMLVQQGYEVVRSQPIDMFPFTYHIESVTELCKKEG